jgi:hypothetical protein
MIWRRQLNRMYGPAVRPALMRIIQLSVRDLLLIKDDNVVIFPSARISAFSGDGECLAILGYYAGVGLD